ncbi:MAG: helix-turn-helix transcriptional regulator [Lachnospiraceae bacterium]|nr:helix-turn-helix transcriptional regulator [Lachnospiraceae bacterium]
MKEMYDRAAAGERLRLKRTLLGMTQDEMAEKIGRAPKYYADIERGSCGMSIETMIALASSMNMSLDYLVFGNASDEDKIRHQQETNAVLDMLDHLSDNRRKDALKLLKLFLHACDNN